MADMNGVVLAEEHDLNNVDYGGDAAVDQAVNRSSRWGRRPAEPWDAAEYGMTLEQAQMMWDAAKTPEARKVVVAELKQRALARADLDSSTGRVAAMTAGEAAWHRLGVNVSEAQNSEWACKLAGLAGWNLAKEKMFLASGAEVKGAWAVVRGDTGAVLGTAGDRYQVWTNEQAFEFMDELVGEKLAMYHTAGSLKGGRLVWMMVKVPKEYRVDGTDDVQRPWLLLSTAHDGSGAVNVLPTAERVVCANTYRMALGRAEKASCFTVRHSKGMAGKVEECRKKLGLMVKGFDGYMEKVNLLAKFQMGKKLTGYFKTLFPTQPPKAASGVAVPEELLPATYKRNAEVVEQLLKNFDNERNSLSGMKGSAWAAYNAVSEYVDHQKKYRGKDDSVRLENKVFNTLFGSGVDLKAEAFNTALQMAQAV